MSTASNCGKMLGLLLFLTVFIGAGQKSVGRISFILGHATDVQVQKNGQNRWSTARLYYPVVNGDKLQTKAESRCEIRMTDASIVRIGEKSKFTVTDLQKREKKQTSLSWGKIWMNIKSLTKKESFFVKTPSAVCSIRGTIFRVETDSTTKIAVYDGTVDVGPNSMLPDENPAPTQPQTRSLRPTVVPGPYEIPPPFEVSLEQWVKIVKGYQIEVRPDGKYAKTKIDSVADTQDDWVNWNRQRDKIN